MSRFFVRQGGRILRRVLMLSFRRGSPVDDDGVIHPSRVRARRGFSIPPLIATMLSLHSTALFVVDGNTVQQHTLGRIVMFGLPHVTLLYLPSSPLPLVVLIVLGEGV